MKTAWEALDEMVLNDAYKVTYQAPKNKISVTGKYIGVDDRNLILQEEQGRFRRVPIDDVIRINYFIKQPW